MESTEEKPCLSSQGGCMLTDGGLAQGPFGPKNAHKGPCGPYGAIWAYMGPNGPVWARMGPVQAQYATPFRKLLRCWIEEQPLYYPPCTNLLSVSTRHRQANS